jgi:hypothetical protein
MSFLVWRQYRLQTAVAALVLAGFAAVLVVTGLSMAAQWHSLLAGCTANGTCGDLAATVSLGGSVAGHDLVIVSIAAPVVFGMLVGAPLLAPEFDARTTDFAWAQSVTRTRWLLVKAGWALLAAAVWGGVIAALVTWWSGPRNAFLENAFGPSTFDTQGIVPIGYAVFATALGIAAGALLRRTLPTVAIVLGGYIALRVPISQYVRPRYMTPVTTFYGVAGNFYPAPGSWLLGGGIVGKPGQLVTGPGGWITKGSPIPAACQDLIPSGRYSNAQFRAAGSCLQHAGFRSFITYQPADRFWAFQGIETGIFAALALGLLAVTYVVITRRDA